VVAEAAAVVAAVVVDNETVGLQWRSIDLVVAVVVVVGRVETNRTTRSSSNSRMLRMSIML
jgi:hypothetical protein